MIVLTPLGLLIAAVGFSQGEYAFAGAGIALAIMGVLLDVTRLP